MSYSFQLATGRELGYSPSQVDAFIEDARKQFEDSSQNLVSSATTRRAEFELVKNGYVIALVDAALDRLEDSFSQRELQRLLAEQGESALEEKLAKLINSLQARLDRPKAKRFSRAPWPLRGYSTKQVDAFCKNLERDFMSGSSMKVTDLREQLFNAKRGGYSEAQVDAFIDRAVEVAEIRLVLNR